jgi:hypothetical protein
MHRPRRRISSHPATIARATFPGMVRSSPFASAHAFFTITIARTSSGTSPMVEELIRKLSIARWVCTP